VTIHYPQGTPTYWQFVSGKVKTIQVKVEVLSIQELLDSDAYGTDYFENSQQRIKFQRWLTELWLQKDKHIQAISEQESPRV
jgi:hypothetical protein